MKGSTWAGEDITLAAADCLKRDIHVFKFIETNGTSPIIDTPLAGLAIHSPLMIAFFEPDHFRAVQNDAVNSMTKALSTSGN